MPGPQGQSKGSVCIPSMVDYCKVNWSNAECTTYLQNVKNNPSDAREVTQSIIKSYLQDKGCADKYGNINNSKCYSANDDFFKETIPSLCSYIPGTCDEILDDFCAPFTRDDLTKDPTLQKICGCHLRTSQYPYNIEGWSSIECDPICISNDCIKQGYQTSNSSYAFKTCTATTCVIDDVTINTTDSKTGGNYFQQACGSCDPSQGGKCSECYISNVNVTEDGAVVNDKLQLSQNCGACYTYSDNAMNRVQVDCSTGKPVSGSGGSSSGGSSSGGSSGSGGVINNNTNTTEGKSGHSSDSDSSFNWKKVVGMVVGVIIFIVIISVLMWLFGGSKSNEVEYYDE
jgi:hypothetical protein